jgi:hypothetical protein
MAQLATMSHCLAATAVGKLSARPFYPQDLLAQRVECCLRPLQPSQTWSQKMKNYLLLDILEIKQYLMQENSKSQNMLNRQA